MFPSWMRCKHNILVIQNEFHLVHLHTSIHFLMYADVRGISNCNDCNSSLASSVKCVRTMFLHCHARNSSMNIQNDITRNIFTRRRYKVYMQCVNMLFYFIFIVVATCFLIRINFSTFRTFLEMQFPIRNPILFYWI